MNRGRATTVFNGAVVVALLLAPTQTPASGAGGIERGDTASIQFKHGLTHSGAPQLERLGLRQAGAGMFSYGLAADYRVPAGVGLELEWLRTEDLDQHGDTGETVYFRQDRAVVMGAFRLSFGALSGGIGLGVSYNTFRVVASQFEFHEEAQDRRVTPIAAALVSYPFWRLRFDLAVRFQTMRVTMEKFGIDQPIYQREGILGFGYVFPGIDRGRRAH